jgi:hypothetical protein
VPDLTYSLNELNARQLQAGVAIGIAVGTLYCFLGYRVLRFVIGMTGFILAGSFAAALAGLITHGKLVFMLLAGVGGGIAGAFALFFLYKTGIFFLGLIGGALAASMILAGRPEDWVSSAVVGAAILGGLSVLLFERLIVTLATSVIGAWITVHGVAIFVLAGGTPNSLRDSLRDEQTQTILLAVWAVVAAAGAATQYATHKSAAPAKK